MKEPTVRTLASLLVMGSVLAAACRAPAEPRQADAAREPVRITYEVAEHFDEGSAALAEVLEVDWPLRARRTVTGEGRDRVEVVTEVGLYLARGGEGLELRQQVVPAVPSFAPRLDVALDGAVDAGHVLRDGEAVVADRACRWYVTRDPLDTANWRLPTDQDRTRTCVGASGHVLVEELFIVGELVRERRAVEVAPGIRLTDDELFGGDPPPGSGAGFLSHQLHDGPVPDRIMTAPPPVPDGFERAVVMGYIELDLATGQATAVGERIAHVRGPDLLVVDQRRGFSLSSGAPDGDVFATPLGEAVLVRGPGGHRLVVDRGDGDRLVVSGTVPVDALVEYARLLVPAEAPG